jgi:oligosaccharide repeat unit polymerase
MDRLSLLSLMPILYYIFKKIRSRPKKILLMSLPILLIVLIIVQGSRRDSEIGLMGWLGLYVDSGVVNLNLLIHTLDHHTWGLRGIFSFVTWTFQGFGINIVPPVNYDIEWNPAQDGFGMMFMDFGWMGIIIFMFIGLICGYIDSQVPFSKLNEPWLEIQSILSFVFLSYWTVPAYDGIEFWLLLITSIALVKYIVKRANVTRSPRRTIKYRLFATTAK